MKLIIPEDNPLVPTPDHTNVTSHEIAGALVGTKYCDVKLGYYGPGGVSIMHSHPNSEHVFFILEGELTIIDDQKNELTAHSGEALYIPAGEIHMAVNHSSSETKYIAVTSPRL